MEEIFTFLFVLGILLAFVTLVGHGIWVLLSLVFGGGRRKKTAGKSWRVEASRHVPEDGISALGALRQQLDSPAYCGTLDEEVRERLIAAIQAEARTLEERRVPAALAAAAEPVVLTPITGGQSATLETGESRPTAPEPAGRGGEELAAPPLPLGERARKYAASREAAARQLAAESAATVEKPIPAGKPSVSVSRLFAAFMEENNIRWGELVGGLLIVGCSVALVISLWSEIAGRPLLQFVLFNGVTASLFGVGMYTERRWKIHTTSRGLLVIATLLVPLNFMALAAFTQASPPVNWLPIVGEAASLVVFALLVWMAGRVLSPGDAALLVVGVMAPCLAQLLVRRYASATMPPGVLYGLAAPPVAVYLVTASYSIGKRWAGESGGLTEVEAHRVLLVLGLVTAAVIMPLALLLYFAPPAWETLHWLSPLVSLGGVPAILAGLLFWRRIRAARNADGGPSPAPLQSAGRARAATSGLQTAGIGVGALGAILMCAAVALAWPDPVTLLPTALATAAAMLAVAIGFGVPAAHVPAALALAAAVTVAFYVLRGEVGWVEGETESLRGALVSATTGYVLMPVAVVFACVAWWLRRTGRREASVMYGMVTAAVAAASLGLALWFGFGQDGDPENITWLLAIYAVGALAAGVLLGRVDAARVGAAILLVAVVQCVVYRYRAAWQLEQPWITALLVHATLMSVLSGGLAMVVAGWLRVSSALWAARFTDVLRAFGWSALVTSAAAAIWLVVDMNSSTARGLAIHLVWLSAVWLILALHGASPGVFTASQAAFVLAIWFGVSSAVESSEWYAAARYPWLDPWFLQLVGIALAGYCLVVSAGRWLTARSAARREAEVVESAPPTRLEAVGRLVGTPWPSVDQIVLCGLVVLVAVLATYAVAPGVAQELSLSEAVGKRVPAASADFEVPGISHTHARGGWSWLLAGSVAVALASGAWQHGVHGRMMGLVVVAMAMCLVFAARWESEVAVASALRWTTAGFFAVGSVVLWLLRGKDRAASSIGAATLDRQVRDMLVAFAVVVYVAMGVFVVQAGLWRLDVSTGVPEVWPWVLLWALLAGVAALFLPYVGVAGRRSETGRVFSESGLAKSARDVLLLLAAAPVLVLAAFAVAQVVDKHPIVGPEPGSWFYRIGVDVSYGVPLGLIALVFVGHAVRDRSSRFAFSAGLLLNVVATIVVLWRLARGGGVLNPTSWITVAQINAIVAATVGLVWLAAIAWHRRRLVEEAKRNDDHLARWPLLLVTQAALAASLCAAFLLPAVISLALVMRPSTWVTAADGAFGWVAVSLATIVAIWMTWRRGVSLHGVAMFVAALVSLTALTASRWDNWVAYRVLMLGGCLAAWLLPWVPPAFNRWVAGIAPDGHPLRWSAPAVRFFAVAAVLLAWGRVWNDPAGPWWTIAALLAISGRNVWIAWWERRRGFMWIAAMLLNIAVTIWWFESGNRLTGTPPGNGADLEWLWFNVLALAVMGLVSVWVERRRILAAAQAPPRRLGLALHRFAAWLIAVALLLGTAAGLLSDLFGEPLVVSFPLIWAAWLASAALAVACLWDPAVRWPVACLYCLGLTAVGIYLDGLDFRAPLFQWALANGLAAYSLGTSGLWAARGWLRRVVGGMGGAVEARGRLLDGYADTFRSESRRDSATWGWLVVANLLVGGFVLFLVVFIQLSVSDFMQRMVGAYAVGAQVAAIGLLARGVVRTALQYLALVWGAMFAVMFGWAFLPPDFAAPWLHRLVATVAALAAVTVFYGFGLVKLLRRENEWTRAASRLMPPLALLTASLVLLVLGMEVTAFVRHGSVQITVGARIVIGAALVVLAAAALAAALLPGRDPLGLSERGRTIYVYLAEALGGLFFLHIRVTMPLLFSDWFLRFWPLVVMGIAFVGVALGEFFERRRRAVLSEPMRTTGALLPLLPALGFWIADSRVHYSLLLLSVGVLYASLSVLRRSFLYGILAAIAANGSLWYLLRDADGLSFLDHPQLWMIPPALSAVVAGYINRERLTAQQMAALRYASAIVIYVSSTADIFINGVADAPWLPAVLAGLSIVGVLIGIWLRVRAFLYLGTAFLIVAIMTIIWHAAIHQQRTYILWGAGILTGALLMALFGLFEKRRDDVLRVVEELKHWEA